MRKLILLWVGFCLVGFSSDNDFIQSLRKKWDLYRSTFKPTQLSIYFNQPSYFPGDTVLFASRYTSIQSGLPVQGRELMHFELISEKDSSVLREQAIIANGFGRHQMVLPKTIPPGNYTFYGYTNWMRNQGDQSFFKNTFVVEGEKQMMDVKKIKYYLHSGNLINEVINEIVVKASAITKVNIIDQNGQEVASATTNELGFSHLKFKPVLGFQYFILIGADKKIPIQEPIINSFAFEQTFSGSQRQIVIHISPRWNPAGKHTFILYNNSAILQARDLPINDSDQIIVTIPPGVTGPLMAQVINNQGENVCATKLLDSTNSTSANIDISDSTPSPRKKIKVNVNLQNSTMGSVEGIFSVRVIHEKLFETGLEYESNHILYHQDGSYSGVLNVIDWKNVLSAKIPEFIRESSIKLEGSAINRESGKPLPDSTKIMLFFQKKAFGYEAYVKDGEFELPILFDVDYRDKIFLSAKKGNNSFNNISVSFKTPESPLLKYSFAKGDQALTSVPNYHFEYNSIKQKIQESYQYFTEKEVRSNIPTTGLMLEDELGEPDYSITMSNYVLFPSMVDVIKELLKSVEYKRVKEQERIRVYVTNYNPQKSGTPLFIINDQLTKNPNDFLGLDPADVLAIKVYRSQNKIFRFGSLSSDGVIMVKTKKPFTSKQSNHIDFKGLLPSANKIKPIQSEPEPALPDLRPCLYWNPDIETDGSGGADFSFYTADDLGTYIIQIFGTTKQGIFFTAEKRFSVTRANQ